MNDNGDKTKEAIRTEERLKRYQVNPDSFIELSEIIVCLLRTPDKGPMLYISGTIFELKQSYTDITLKLQDHIRRTEYELAQKNKSVIQKPGFLQGLRGMK